MCVVVLGRGRGGGGGSKPRHPIMLSQRQGHTPQKAQPHFPANRRVFQLLITQNRPPAFPPSPLPTIGCSGRGAAIHWAAAAPAHLVEPANENPGQAGKGGVRSSRKRRLEGGGVWAHATHSVNQEHMEGRGNSPGPPTHSRTLVYVALIPTEDYTHTHTHTPWPIVFSTWQDTFKASDKGSYSILLLDSSSLNIHTRKAGGKAVVEGHAWATRAHN